MQRRRPIALGPLELAVIDALWMHGPAPVQGVHAAVGSRRGLATNTIQSTLERLVRKGLATRAKRGRAFEYRAAVSRDEWASRALADALGAIPRADASLMLASFVDLAERAGEASLAELEALVRERRRSREEPT